VKDPNEHCALPYNIIFLLDGVGPPETDVLYSTGAGVANGKNMGISEKRRLRSERATLTRGKDMANSLSEHMLRFN
jgi:hypothetical protein